MVKFPSAIKEDEACAASLNLPISRKKSIRICKKLNNKRLSEAKMILKEIKEGKSSIEGKRWPKACEHFLKLLKLAEANAEEKGLVGGLQIKLLVAERGGRRGTRRRRRRIEQGFGRELKSTNLKVIVHGG